MDRANGCDETGSEGFDYSCLDRETCTRIQVYAVEIRGLMKRASQDVVVVGQKLIMVKEQLPHGQFGPWLRAEFAWSERTARQFMSAAEVFQTVNFADLVVAPSALYVLAAPSTPEDAREEALQRAQEGEPITHALAQQIVRSRTLHEVDETEQMGALAPVELHGSAHATDLDPESVDKNQSDLQEELEAEELMPIEVTGSASEALEIVSPELVIPEGSKPRKPATSRRWRERIQNDFYETAEGLTRALLHRCPELETALILEPCAGDGAIARLFPECITNDVDPQRSCDFALDATDPDSWNEFDEVDWVVTNPPFSKAAQILPLALEHALDGVAFLLRLTYLEPCSERADWLKEHADQMRFCFPCNPRPQFRQDTDSTDSTTVAWFIWSKHWSWAERGISPTIQFITGWR